MIKLLGKVELSIGLLLIALCSYYMLESTFNHESDRHGYVLIISLFGAGIGGLISFAGSVCILSKEYKLLAHIPIVVYGFIVYFVFNTAY